jgi:nitrate/nitrite transport system ATP-binding protein
MLDSLTRFELQEVLIKLWRENRITTLMVTHDVDEALYLSDRVVCMTDGPDAEVGDILPVHFARPRERQTLQDHPDYSALRERLIEFLEVRAHRPPTRHISSEAEQFSASTSQNLSANPPSNTVILTSSLSNK